MTTTTTATTLEIDEVAKSYGGTRAVDGVSLTAGRGIIGLLGPNGAGKTTLLRMVATVLAPDAGRLRLLDLDPADPASRTEIRRRLGYLPQSPGLYPGFTAFRPRRLRRRAQGAHRPRVAARGDPTGS